MDEKSNEIAHARIVAREEHGGFLPNLEFATHIWILIDLQHGILEQPHNVLVGVWGVRARIRRSGGASYWGGLTFAEDEVHIGAGLVRSLDERAGFHGCQMPERLLERLIKVSSNPGELVVDPFAGSGSTLIVAKKLGRACLGFELSSNYAARIRKRLEQTYEGQPLEGAEEPKLSAPKTAEGRRLQTPAKIARSEAAPAKSAMPASAAQRLPPECSARLVV